MMLLNYVVLVLISTVTCAPIEEMGNNTENLNSKLGENCNKAYSLTCIKLDLANFVPNLGTSRKFKLLPGLTLLAGGFDSKPPDALKSYSEKNLDGYLVKALDSFINSIALKVDIMDKGLTEKLEDIGHHVIADGRGRRKRIHSALYMGGMVSVGTLLALSFATISAMAGKAILLSLLSLAMTLMRGGGGGGGGSGGGPAKTTYEIITHTVPHHDDYTNRWPELDTYFVKPPNI